jgi:hypothetical protein
MSVIKANYPLKSQFDKNRIYEGIINGHIDEWIWRKIIKKVYDPSDYEILEARFAQMIDNKKSSKLHSN